jgi:hypothetical protein
MRGTDDRRDILAFRPPESFAGKDVTVVGERVSGARVRDRRIFNSTAH